MAKRGFLIVILVGIVIMCIYMYRVDLLVPDIVGCNHMLCRLLRVNDSKRSEEPLRLVCNSTRFISLDICKKQNPVCNNSTGLNKTEDGVEYECSHLMSIQEFKGGLGNQMFQMASVIGVAAMHGYTPVIDTKSYLFGVFTMKNGIQFSLTNVKNMKERICCTFDRKVLDLDHSKNWTLSVFLQSWKYFGEAEDRVRKSYTFSEKYMTSVGQHLKKISKEGHSNIAVHVRRGDFMSDFNRNLGYTTASVAYIRRAMAYMTNKYKNVQFIFASNDLKWCKDNFKDENVYFSIFDTREQDMALLSSCDHAIITTGSFSWWVGWLSGGTTIYYRGYPKPGTDLDKLFNSSGTHDDYYPAHWVGMD